jgi:hypothetical protein
VMLLPIRKPDGLIYRTLICDHCRRPIHEEDFAAATVDFDAIDEGDLATASHDALSRHAVEHHFHGECAPSDCTRSQWAKLFRAIPAMVANVFDAKGSAIGRAASAERATTTPDPLFP